MVCVNPKNVASNYRYLVFSSLYLRRFTFDQKSPSPSNSTATYQPFTSTFVDRRRSISPKIRRPSSNDAPHLQFSFSAFIHLNPPPEKELRWGCSWFDFSFNFINLFSVVNLHRPKKARRRGRRNDRWWWGCYYSSGGSTTTTRLEVLSSIWRTHHQWISSWR